MTAFELKRTTNGYPIQNIFGTGVQGNTLSEIAKNSSVLFVRSQDQLAKYKPAATGRIITAWEALNTFGIEVLEEIEDYNSAIIVSEREEPARSIRNRMDDLGLTINQVAEFSGVDASKIDLMLRSEYRSDIHDLMQVARHLAIDESSIVFKQTPKDETALAARLKKYRNTLSSFSLSQLKKMLEAGWIIQKQYELQQWLGISNLINRFEPSDNYGTSGYPAWQHGHYLASQTRGLLKIPPDEPIESMKNLVESTLGIPLVNTELQSQIAGATISNNKHRGIVVNTLGNNRNSWVKRVTIAHELGHLLWDPDQQLATVKVDQYEELEGLTTTGDNNRDENFYIEQRANAFAIEFLAPMRFVEETFESEESSSDGLRKVMEKFGISFTAARFQVWNAKNRTIPIESLTVADVQCTQHWDAAEEPFAYFNPPSVPNSKRGRFAYLVARAFNENLISTQSAATYLDCTDEEIEKDKESIFALYD